MAVDRANIGKIGCILFSRFGVCVRRTAACSGIADRTNFMSQATCRPGCGACCIAPSISSPIPGMPNGKPAGVRCVQLDDANRCMIFGKMERPPVCESLQPSTEMCGASREHALLYLARLDALTS
jgi:hypothetical protein